MPVDPVTAAAGVGLLASLFGGESKRGGGGGGGGAGGAGLGLSFSSSKDTNVSQDVRQIIAPITGNFGEVLQPLTQQGPLENGSPWDLKLPPPRFTIPEVGGPGTVQLAGGPAGLWDGGTGPDGGSFVTRNTVLALLAVGLVAFVALRSF